MSDLWDRLLARIATRILRHLFGCCEPPYDPDCLSCATARVVRGLEDI